MHIYHAFVSMNIVHVLLLPATWRRSCHAIMFVFDMVYVHYASVIKLKNKQNNRTASWEIRMVIRFESETSLFLQNLLSDLSSLWRECNEWKLVTVLKIWNTESVVVHNIEQNMWITAFRSGASVWPHTNYVTMVVLNSVIFLTYLTKHPHIQKIRCYVQEWFKSRVAKLFDASIFKLLANVSISMVST